MSLMRFMLENDTNNVFVNKALEAKIPYIFEGGDDTLRSYIYGVKLSTLYQNFHNIYYKLKLIKILETYVCVCMMT